MSRTIAQFRDQHQITVGAAPGDGDALTIRRDIQISNLIFSELGDLLRRSTRDRLPPKIVGLIRLRINKPFPVRRPRTLPRKAWKSKILSGLPPSAASNRDAVADGIRVSDNYLTGERVITIMHAVRGKYAKETNTMRRIERKKIFLEETTMQDIDFDALMEEVTRRGSQL